MVQVIALVLALVTPAHEAAACAAAFHFHHVNAVLYTRESLWQSAWHHAWHLARLADADLRYAIRHYLFTGHNWSQVPYLCGSGL